MLLLAGLLSVSVCYQLLIGLHGLSPQRLYLLPPGAVWHSSQSSLPAFGASVGCPHRNEPQRRVNYPLILECLQGRTMLHSIYRNW